MYFPSVMPLLLLSFQCSSYLAAAKVPSSSSSVPAKTIDELIRDAGSRKLASGGGKVGKWPPPHRYGTEEGGPCEVLVELDMIISCQQLARSSMGRGRDSSSSSGDWAQPLASSPSSSSTSDVDKKRTSPSSSLSSSADVDEKRTSSSSSSSSSSADVDEKRKTLPPFVKKLAVGLKNKISQIGSKVLVTNPRWTMPIHFYFADRAQYSNADKAVIRAAIREISAYTCITFNETTEASGRVNNNGAIINNKLRFEDGNNCRSYVGMVKHDQNLTLAKTCRVRGIVIHEIMHALGLVHEQARPDRDTYVTIDFSNIDMANYQQFLRFYFHEIWDYGIGYDYKSIMHYGSKSFSKNGRRTIITKDSAYQNIIGTAQGMSILDAKTLSRHYLCHPPVGCNLTDDMCPGDGFVDKHCKCLNQEDIKEIETPETLQDEQTEDDDETFLIVVVSVLGGGAAVVATVVGVHCLIMKVRRDRAAAEDHHLDPESPQNVRKYVCESSV